MKNTVKDLLAFLAACNPEEKVVIYGTTRDDGTGVIYVGNKTFENYL